MNMPRMNGLQCLKEIKKIKRLNHVPVFMYSTSADPSVVEENKRLGATDFIVKPSSINDLTKILSRIIRKKVFTAMCFLFCLNLVAQQASAQSDVLPLIELKKLSVEQLMDIVVTSVSKKPEKLTEVASAIQVITGEDIKASCATRLPEALRLTPNMQVAQSGSHDWGITSRGFNGAPVANSSLANKLLVMIDGRTVYTPLFGGVYWDVQNVLLEDVDRIEVISGPGGTLWGANAVNGIVNVISKNAKETQGLYASGATGTLLKDYVAVRYGTHIDTTVYMRIYGQRFDYISTSFAGDIDAMDSWNLTQGGFRMDYFPAANNTFTLQGDIYGGTEDDTASTLVNGQNILGRWSHTFSNKSGLVVQAYFDRTFRNITRQGYIDKLNTYDIDIQHSINLGKRNQVLSGVDYRVANDNINSILNNFSPSQRTLQQVSFFIQDRFTIIKDKLSVTIGSKFLYNDYTNFETQPSIRLAWTPEESHTVWAAVSRAVRTPSRFDADYVAPELSSYDNFTSEKVLAYELGYRMRPFNPLLISFAAFYNEYTDLRSIDVNLSPPPLYYFANNMKAVTYGIELSASFIATSWWRLRGGFTHLNESFQTTSSNTLPQSKLLEAIDPDNQFLLQSIMSITKNISVDVLLRYVDALPTTLDGSNVPEYTAFDLKVSWQHKWLTVSVCGQNLSANKHFEFGKREIPKRIMGSVTLRF